MYIITRSNELVMQSAEPLTVTEVESIPARTNLDGELGAYQRWALMLEDGTLHWRSVDRPQTQMEQLEQRNAELEAALGELANIVGGAE